MTLGRRLVSLLSVTILVAGGCSVDWTQSGFDAGHSGASPDTGITPANIGSLHVAWSGDTHSTLGGGSPAVATGVAYAVSDDGKVYAYSTSGCSGAARCLYPLWSAVLPGRASSTPAVTNGIVFVTSAGNLYAFDAAGTNACFGSGLQRRCLPLWSATADVGLIGDPVVADGLVHLETNGGIQAFDAAGKRGCTEAPSVCTPVRTFGAAFFSHPAVAGGMLYASTLVDWDDGRSLLVAFDATGSPAWTSEFFFYLGDPVVSGGFVYVKTGSGDLAVFDAAGSAECDDPSQSCVQPLWTAGSGGRLEIRPVIANGVVYDTTADGALVAFDASGVTGCTSSPRRCAPLWSSPTGHAAGRPSVAGGVVYLGIDGQLQAFDAAGTIGCSGAPKVCRPLKIVDGTGTVSGPPAVAHGRIFANTAEHGLVVIER